MKEIRTKDEFIRLLRSSATDRDKQALESWHTGRIGLHQLAVYLMKNNRMGDIVVPLSVIEEVAIGLGYGKEEKEEH